jgi:hypothetical protein
LFFSSFTDGAATSPIDEFHVNGVSTHRKSQIAGDIVFVSRERELKAKEEEKNPTFFVSLKIENQSQQNTCRLSQIKKKLSRESASLL